MCNFIGFDKNYCIKLKVSICVPCEQPTIRTSTTKKKTMAEQPSWSNEFWLLTWWLKSLIAISILSLLVLSSFGYRESLVLLFSITCHVLLPILLLVCVAFPISLLFISRIVSLPHDSDVQFCSIMRRLGAWRWIKKYIVIVIFLLRPRSNVPRNWPNG